MTDINLKLDNFKAFVKEVSKNTTTVQEYENLSWFKVQALAMVLLIPQRDNLQEIVKSMQERLEFDDMHLPKFQRYLEFFIEYLTGEASTSTQINFEGSYEEHLERVMASQGHP